MTLYWSPESSFAVCSGPGLQLSASKAAFVSVVTVPFTSCPIACLMLLFRLERLNEARQGQVNRVKIVEKEREGLEGEKMAAEAYVYKDAERLGTQSKIFQRFMSDGQVGTLDRQVLFCFAHSQPRVRICHTVCAISQG